MGAGTRACRSSPMSATPSSPGTGRPARCSNTVSTGWWRSTRSPSARTWPASGWVSSPAIPSWWSSSAASGAMPASWCPGPAQAAGAVALSDDGHVEVQRDRYLERLTFMAEVLGRAGCPVGSPRGASICGCRSPRRGGPTPGPWPRTWRGAGGILVSPGDLYGHGRRRLRPRGRGAAHGSPGAGGGPPSRRWVGWPMADLQASIEELWERRGELSPKDTDAARLVEEAIGLLDSGEARVAEPGAGTGRNGRARVAEEGHPALLRLRGMETIESGPFEYADKLPAQARLRRSGGAGGAGRLGPLGLLPRPRRDPDAELRQHRGPGGRGDDGRHLGHRRFVRPDRRPGPPLGRGGHRGRARAAQRGAGGHRGRRAHRQPLHGDPGGPGGLGRGAWRRGRS